MYFDYTIVLGFALAGAALALLARRRANGGRGGVSGEAGLLPQPREVQPALLAGLFAAALAVLFPCALVVRDCLQDRGVAQSRGVAGLAVFEIALLLAGLSVGLAYAWKRCGPGPESGLRDVEPATHERT